MLIEDEFTQFYFLEISSSICPDFSVGENQTVSEGYISQRNLALISGSLAHEIGSVEVTDDGESLRIGWLQRYPI